MSLDIALQHHAIARRQLAAALKELAAAERVGAGPFDPPGVDPMKQIEAMRRALGEAEADLAKAPVRTVWAFLIKVEALVDESMSAATVEALRRDANALLDAQSKWAA